MECRVDSVVEIRDEYDRSDKRARHGEYGEDIPGAFTEAVPSQADDAYHDVGYEDDGEEQEDVV